MNDLTTLEQEEVLEPKLTKKQRAFLKEFLKTGNGTKAALLTYDTDDINVAAAIASENLSKLKNPIKVYLEANGFSFLHLMATLMGGLGAKKIHTSHTEPDREVDDWQTRHKYLETAGKWLGIETDTAKIMQQINVEKPRPLLDPEPIVIVRYTDDQGNERPAWDLKKGSPPIMGGTSHQNPNKNVIALTNFKKDKNTETFDERSLSDEELDELAKGANSN